ncbi:MAG: ATP-binding protein [Candidatus Njordarchaeales archaeon]
MRGFKSLSRNKKRSANKCKSVHHKRSQSPVAKLLLETYSDLVERVKQAIEKGSRIILVHGNDTAEIQAVLRTFLSSLGKTIVIDAIDLALRLRSNRARLNSSCIIIRNIEKLSPEYLEEVVLAIEDLARRGRFIVMIAESVARLDPVISKIAENIEAKNPSFEKIRQLLEFLFEGYRISDEVVEVFLGLSFNQITFLIKKAIDEGLDPLNPDTIRMLRQKYFGVPEVKKVTWEDLGGIRRIKDILYERIVIPYRRLELAKKLGYKLPKGILLVGPPGTGKTSIALALANELGWNFYELGIGRILSSSSIVGEGEREIMETFERARKSVPSIILIDEIDGIGMVRGNDPNEAWRAPLLLTLLSEIDGVRETEGILVIATTNRPDRLDPALIRRFDLVIEVPLPDQKAREEIFKIHLRDAIKNKLVDDSVDFSLLAKETEGFSGAEIAHVCEAAKAEAIRNNGKITMDILLRKIKEYKERKKKLLSQLTEWDIAPSFLFT